jgi:hypothetical protein
VRSRALNDLRLARLKLKKPVRANLPAVILEAMAACVQIVEDRGRFPELGSGRGQRRFLFGQPNRERHLRRLEACALVLMSLLSHLDLPTLRAGRPRKDGSCDAIRTLRPRRRAGRTFTPRREQSSIEEETGLQMWTVLRALRDLEDAGYVSSHQPRRDWKDGDGQTRWRSFPTVRVITKTCLMRLGVTVERLEMERRDAYRRQLEPPAPIVDIRIRRVRQRIIRAQAMAAKRLTRPAPRPPRRL